MNTAFIESTTPAEQLQRSPVLLDSTRQAYGQRLLSDVKVVISLMKVAIEGQASSADLARLKQTLYKVSSIASTYGYPKHTRIARLLERAVDALEQDGMDDAISDLLFAKTKQLIHMISENEQISDNWQKPQMMGSNANVTGIAKKSNKDGFWSINTLLVGEWPHVCKSLKMKTHKSMDIGFSDLANLKVRPLNIVVKKSDLQNNQPAAAALKAYLDQLLVKPKIIYVTDDKTPHGVSDSLRNGADVCLQEAELVSYLLDYSSSSAIESMSVAILDNNDKLFNKMSRHLKGLDINTLFSNSVIDFIEQTTACPPDLFIVDMALKSEMSGIDAVRYIRNHPAFASHPIIMITSDARPDVAYTARNMGADDVLLNSINEQCLSSIVAHKLMRFKRLSRHVNQDLLTGLASQEVYQANLKGWIKYARRRGIQVSLCLIDIDNLKDINQLYGHLSGNDVLKSLAQIIKARLRESDVIARSGADQFVLVLPEADSAHAIQVVSDILSLFSSQAFQFANHQVHATFSAGIAEFPVADSVEDLIEHAENALLAAKAQGKTAVIQRSSS